jgi:uncharacterized membrane protein YphA (DoxX/SURF4 family)
MNTALWIVQIALALMFVVAGVQKSMQPKERLVEKLPWTKDFSPSTIRFIGITELLAAVGLVLPAATGIVPILTPLAASGVVVIMILAILTHRRRGETGAIVFNAALLIAAAFVAWARLGSYA